MLSALSHALDLTEGQPPGHTIRSCIIGMRLGETVGLSSDVASKHLDRAARMLVVADMFDALTSDRPYRRGLSRDDAVKILRSDAGVRIDGEAIDALTNRTSSEPVGRPTARADTAP